jgi:hypothetical protein
MASDQSCLDRGEKVQSGIGGVTFNSGSTQGSELAKATGTLARWPRKLA